MMSSLNARVGLLLLLAVSIATVVKADTSNHRYKQGEHIELYVNKVRFV